MQNYDAISVHGINGLYSWCMIVLIEIEIWNWIAKKQIYLNYMGISQIIDPQMESQKLFKYDGVCIPVH